MKSLLSEDLFVTALRAARAVEPRVQSIVSAKDREAKQLSLIRIVNDELNSALSESPQFLNYLEWHTSEKEGIPHASKVTPNLRAYPFQKQKGYEDTEFEICLVKNLDYKKSPHQAYKIQVYKRRCVSDIEEEVHNVPEFSEVVEKELEMLDDYIIMTECIKMFGIDS